MLTRRAFELIKGNSRGTCSLQPLMSGSGAPWLGRTVTGATRDLCLLIFQSPCYNSIYVMRDIRGVISVSTRDECWHKVVICLKMPHRNCLHHIPLQHNPLGPRAKKDSMLFVSSETVLHVPCCCASIASLHVCMPCRGMPCYASRHTVIQEMGFSVLLLQLVH